MHTTLTDGHIVLRPFATEDLEATYAAACESIGTVGRWMAWCHPGYELHEASAWIDTCRRNWTAGASCEFAVFDAANAFCGGVGVNSFNRLNNFANLGYWVRSSRLRRGIATAAAHLAAGFALDQLQFARVEIVIHTDNVASRRVAEKLGATFECVARNRVVLHGRSHDAAVYSLIPEDLDG
jgi:ribosomal-protein-serine acetyltransferase